MSKTYEELKPETQQTIDAFILCCETDAMNGHRYPLANHYPTDLPENLNARIGTLRSLFAADCQELPSSYTSWRDNAATILNDADNIQKYLMDPEALGENIAQYVERLDLPYPQQDQDRPTPPLTPR